MTLKEELASSLAIGAASARVNLVPMLVLQSAAVGGAVAYFLSPVVRTLLEPVAEWHRSWGWCSAFLSQAFFCGLIPGAFLLCIRSLRPPHLLRSVVAQAVWCGCFGVANDALYRGLADLYGDRTTLLSLIAKTAFDQVVWSVFVVTPLNAVFFFWLGRDFSFVRLRDEWPHRFFRRLVLPNLISNWIVWIPVSLSMYSFPQPLQIHVNGIACAFWVLMCLQIGRRSN